MTQSWTRSKEKSNLHSLIHTCFHTVLRVSLMCLPLTHFIFSSLKDKRKTANVTPALIRKVDPPIELYKNPPKIRPKMLAKAPKLPAKPCTTPCSFDPARLDNMDMKEGHIRPLPSANNITAPNTETRLFDANKTKFVPNATNDH